MLSEIAFSNLNRGVKAEVENIKKDHGETFHSMHEGYAILKEEVEEALEEAVHCNKTLREIWLACRNDEPDECKKLLNDMTHYAYYLLEEACQVAAVVEKFSGSL